MSLEAAPTLQFMIKIDYKTWFQHYIYGFTVFGKTFLRVSINNGPYHGKWYNQDHPLVKSYHGMSEKDRQRCKRSTQFMKWIDKPRKCDYRWKSWSPD